MTFLSSPTQRPTGAGTYNGARQGVRDSDRPAWLAGITERRRRLGATVTVATTEFTVDFLAQIWPALADEFTRRRIELNIVHVRTRDFWTQLDANNVDLVAGSIAAAPGPDPALAAYDVIEWHREALALVTNLPAHDLPATPVDQRRLPAVPLLAPTADQHPGHRFASGLGPRIADFLRLRRFRSGTTGS